MAKMQRYPSLRFLYLDISASRFLTGDSWLNKTMELTPVSDATMFVGHGGSIVQTF